MKVADERLLLAVPTVTETGEHPAPSFDLAALQRVRELEADLAAAQREMAARMAELEDKTAALENANAELRSLTGNLDQIVRQRTRALAESDHRLRRQNVELERMSRMREEFIAIAAHELRTPMTSLVGYLDLFAERVGRGIDPEARRQLHSLHRSAHRIKRLVEDMLDVTRLETGSLTLRRGRCSLGEILVAVVEELRPLAGDRKLRAELGDVPELDGDADKLHQVVANLVGHALRYAPDGTTIRLTLERSGPHARLRVRHEGRGIPPELRDRLFDPFIDLDSAKHHSSRGPDSAGLGLGIARGIVELHGGSIEVESEEGKYTELAVVLPLTPR